MGFRSPAPVILRPPLLARLCQWTFALLACTACVGGQSFDDGRDGLEKGEGRDVDAPPTSPEELDSAAAPDVDPPRNESVSRAIPGVLLLADGEQAAGFIEDVALTAAGAAMHGAWYTLDDVLDCPLADQPRAGMISPAKGTKFINTRYEQIAAFPAELDAPNEAGLRIWGGGHVLWGALLGCSFDSLDGRPLPYDLTKTGAIGIRFWARSAMGELTVHVKIQDKWSEPQADPMLCCFWDQNVCGANSCGKEGNQGCFDAPFFDVQVGTEWQLYEIPFGSLWRTGFGTWADGVPHGSELLAAKEAYGLQFEVPMSEAFDIYFDNIGLLVPE